jgi:hypothetical protein
MKDFSTENWIIHRLTFHITKCTYFARVFVYLYSDFLPNRFRPTNIQKRAINTYLFSLHLAFSLTCQLYTTPQFFLNWGLSNGNSVVICTLWFRGKYFFVGNSVQKHVKSTHSGELFPNFFSFWPNIISRKLTLRWLILTTTRLILHSKLKLAISRQPAMTISTVSYTIIRFKRPLHAKAPLPASFLRKLIVSVA